MKVILLVVSTLVVAIHAETKTCTTTADPRCSTDAAKQRILPTTDCTQFLRCEGGKACVYDCPAGLHFNAATLTCDWPHQACCDPRLPCMQEALPPTISVPAPSPVLMPPSTNIVVPPQPPSFVPAPSFPPAPSMPLPPSFPPSPSIPIVQPPSFPPSPSIPIPMPPSFPPSPSIPIPQPPSFPPSPSIPIQQPPSFPPSPSFQFPLNNNWMG